MSALPTPLPCISTAVPRLARYQCGSWGCSVSTVLRRRSVVTRFVATYGSTGSMVAIPRSPVCSGLARGAEMAELV